MKESDITDRLNDLLEEMGFERVKPFELQSSFKGFLGMDSLDYVEYLMKVEKAFGVLIEDEKANEIETFEQMVQHIQELTSLRVPPYPAAMEKRNPA